METYKLPAGTYIVSDPCYVLSNETYDSQFLEQSWVNGKHVSFITVNGRPMVCFMTAHGDGEYNDDDGRCYGVDSGTIAIIPIESCDGDEIEGMYSHKVEMSTDFECHYDKRGGTMHFGNISIMTDGQYCEHCGCEYHPDDSSEHWDCEEGEGY